MSLPYERICRYYARKRRFKVERFRYYDVLRCEACGADTDTLIKVSVKLQIEPNQYGYNYYCVDCASALFGALGGAILGYSHE